MHKILKLPVNTQAFDAARKRIYEVADKVYVRGGKASCAFILAAENF